MPQTEAFETDFWKHANLRKMWDDIIPGEPRKTIPYTLTRDAIELYCASVGESHPIYFDEDYARTTVYGGLIAPPAIHILLMFACTPADDWMRSPGTVNAGPTWSYKIPARPRGGIIMHGMNNFGLISRMVTDWAYPAGAIHRRLETRWLKPVRPGDTIRPTGILRSKQVTANSRWVLIDVMVRNQAGEKVATGEALVEFPIR